MKPQWILVANASHARLFSRESDTDPLVPIATMEHPESRMSGRELGGDRIGHDVTDRRPGGVMLTPRTDPRQKEHAQFAHELAKRLEQGLESGQCGSILLFASSPFLGVLKGELGAQVQKAVRATADVDLTSYGLTEVEQRIERELQGRKD